jgi:hypothetical protein
MQEHKNLSPALRRRLAGHEVPFRKLVAEFSQHIAPETAIRAFERQKTEYDAMLNPSKEQMLMVGRVRVLQSALSRIKATFKGSRRSLDRVYSLPAEANSGRYTMSAFLKLPSPEEALAHVEARFRDLAAKKKRMWREDDQKAVRALSQVVRGAINAGLASELINTPAPEPTPEEVGSTEPPLRRPFGIHTPPWVTSGRHG